MREPSNPPSRTGGPYQQGGLRDKTRRQFLELYKVLRAVPLNAEGSGTQQFQISVRTPSSQVRTLIELNFEPMAGTVEDLDITGWGNDVWLAGTADALGGASSQDIPNSSVVGMRSAPRAFPSTVIAGVVTPDNGLLGFSREFVTASPWITGITTLGAGGAPNAAGGAWILHATWQPDGVVLPDDAWAEIAAMCELKANRIDG
jgi:hypothetical protein